MTKKGLIICASASDDGVSYTFLSHFFQGPCLFRCGVKFNFLNYFVCYCPFGKSNLTFRVLQSWPQFQKISHSRILTSHFWSLNLHTFFIGATFSGLRSSSIVYTFLFNLTLLANVIYPSNSNLLIECHVFL